MSSKVERYRRRWLRQAVKRCTAMVVGMLLISTSINVCADYKLQKDLEQVKLQQTDTLNTIMYHRIYTEPEVTVANPIIKVNKQERISLNESDRELITRTVMSEASTYEGMMAVAQVIQNRAALWDMTPYEVVTQEGQFAKPYTGELSTEAGQAVKAVFSEGQKVFASNVTHFHSLDFAEPYWTKNKEYVGIAGGNKFWI